MLPNASQAGLRAPKSPELGGTGATLRKVEGERVRDRK